MPTAIYTGRADRYYVGDEQGHRVYLPRGETVEVTDEVAARLSDHPQVWIGGPDVTGDADAAPEPAEGASGEQTGRASRSRTKSRAHDGTSEEHKNGA